MVESPTSEGGQIHLKLVERERDINVYNLVVSPTNEGDQIHLKLVERERHQCIKSGSIPTSEGGQIHLKLVEFLNTEVDVSNLQLFQFDVSLSKKLYQHCFI